MNETFSNYVGTSTDSTTTDTISFSGFNFDPPLDKDEEEISVKREGDEIVIRIKRKKPEQKIVYVPYYPYIDPYQTPVKPWWEGTWVTICSTPND